MKKNKNKFFWDSQKTHVTKDVDDNELKLRCATGITIYSWTWFFKSKLQSKKVLILVNLYFEKNFSFKQAQDLLEISATTLTDWTQFCGEIISSYTNEHQAKVGGVGRTVE